MYCPLIALVILAATYLGLVIGRWSSMTPAILHGWPGHFVQGHYRESTLMPSVQAVGERAYLGDPELPQIERHPGAGRLVGSRAVEHDLHAPRYLVVAPLELIRTDP